MKRWTTMLIAGACVAGLSLPALAQQNGPEDERTQAGAPLTLPEDAAEQARESAANGLDTANEARTRGRDFGQDRAAEAREQHRDAVRTMRESRGPRGR